MTNYYFTAEKDEDAKDFQHALADQGHSSASSNLGDYFYIKVPALDTEEKMSREELREVFRVAYENGCEYDGLRTSFTLDDRDNKSKEKQTKNEPVKKPVKHRVRRHSNDNDRER